MAVKQLQERVACKQLVARHERWRGMLCLQSINDAFIVPLSVRLRHPVQSCCGDRGKRT
jgi:hypothetical protein